MTSARDTWLLQLRAQKAAATVLSLFGAHGIDVVPVKGIVTSHTLYRDFAERTLSDVDLRVRPEDFRHVLRVVRAAGFRILQLMHTYGNVVFSVDGVSIDVETHPSAPSLCALTTDAMIRRATPSNLLGVPHILPDPYDHAVVLMLNVFKDKFVHAFRWAVRDVEVLPDRLEAAPLVERLAEVKALSVGLVVAEWMVSERGCLQWRPLVDAIAPRAPRLRYARTHRWLLDHVAYDASVLRLHTRFGADSVWLRAKSLVVAGAWAAEALATRSSGAGFVRQVLPDEVLVPRRSGAASEERG